MTRRTGRMPAIYLALAVGSIAACVAVAASSGGPSDAEATPSAADNSPAQKIISAYGLLKEPPNAADYAHNPFALSPRIASEVDPAQARVSVYDGAEYWVAASATVLCVSRVADRQFGGGCRPVAGAENDGFFTMQEPAPNASDAANTSITGLVPDGVEVVTIALQSGKTIDAPVRSNIVAATVEGAPSTARFVTTDNRTVVKDLNGGGR
jgi:hypothetical protein